MHSAAPPQRLTALGLLRLGGFRRLLATRFAAQWGDGLFQAGLGGAVLFNPEREADPAVIAAGLAVLLLPYSFIGPFAGALLDRWDRRMVMITGNLVRAVLIVAVSLAVATGVAGTPLFLGALLVTGVSRFVLAGLSASLPHVVPTRHLVQANAMSVTLGTIVALIGSGCAIGLRALAGAGNTGSAVVTCTAVIGSLLAAIVVAGFRRRRLGPDETDEPAETVIAIATGLWHGLRAAAAARTVAAGMLGLTAHRLAFGIATLISLLLYRHTFTDQGLLRAGLTGVGQLLAAGGAGVLVAALLTPWLVARLGRPTVVRAALVLGAAGILALGVPMVMPTVLAASFVLSAAGQVVKLSLDATVQRDISDESRGRVFALYDAVFNTGYVVAVAVGAWVVPINGQAPGLLVAAAVVYLIGAGAHIAVDRGYSAERSATVPAERDSP